MIAQVQPIVSRGVQKRPPVVVILGHVDHGKTTLLDRIRKTTVAEREAGPSRLAHVRSLVESEAGGITQNIGAYEITLPPPKEIPRDAQDDFATKRKITFIDTPGHEAFSKMRVRGVTVADVAVLLVAADDGVKPQTKEAIKTILDAKIPSVVALNKIDKAKDLVKVKTQLTEEGVLLEGFGGSVSMQAISAKTGEGVPELLDLIALTSDLEELTYDASLPGEGMVLEAKLDSKRGMLVTTVVRNGTVRVGDTIVTDSAAGKIKQLHDFLGKSIQAAEPSAPIVITGFTALPETGELFRTGGTHALTSTKAKPALVVAGVKTRDKDTTTLFLILKADTAGGLEALQEVMRQISLPSKTEFSVVARSVGEVTDGDVQLAVSTGAIVIGFRTKITKQADTLARAQRVKVVLGEIVYELSKTIEAELFGKVTEELVGDLEVLAVFGEPKGQNAGLPAGRQVVGGEVKVGEMRKMSAFEVIRGGTTIGKGRVVNLQESKKDVSVVPVGKQCGLLIEADAVVKVGDHLIVR